MEHSFDIKIAKEYGIEEAIILKNIYFWVQKNTANEKHFYDGKYWTYNSKKAFAELFPYMTENKIRYALDNLKKNGLIETGNYNESSYDRTLWYTLTEKAYELLGISQMHRGKFPNGQGDCAAPSGKIHHSNNIYINNTNTNTDINTDINTDKSAGAKQTEKLITVNEKDKGFEQFWEIYPTKRKKHVAKIAWLNMRVHSQEQYALIGAAVERYKKTDQWQEKNGRYIPDPDTFLQDERWTDEIKLSEAVQAADREAQEKDEWIAKNKERWAAIPPEKRKYRLACFMGLNWEEVRDMPYVGTQRDNGSL